MAIDSLINEYFLTGAVAGLPDRHFIGGEFVESLGQQRLTSVDPGSENVLGEFSGGDHRDIEVAVASSADAFKSWKRVSPAKRGEILYRTAQLMKANSAWLSFVECLDSGKTLAEAEGDVAGSIRLLEYYAGAADKLDGRSVPLAGNYMGWTIREPVGVTAHIIPWNYPTSTFIRGVAPALAAGCTAIAKPAETTPYTALLLAEMFTEAGLPDGVLNVVTGLGVDAGAPLVAHRAVNHVTFTGSVNTGVNVMQSVAQNMTRLTLELGGKSPLIALDDCDIDAAVEGARWAIFSHSGQICSAGSRLIVHESVHEALLERLVEVTNRIKIGHPLKNPDMGAINSKSHLDVISGHVRRAIERGSDILTGGGIMADPESGKGWFFAPTIIDNLAQNDPVVQQEIFGPVLAVQVVRSDEEAIEAANSTEFGLVSGVYTRDIGRALNLAREIDAGQITINDYWAGGVELPFGGTRKSGFGKEKGWEGIEAYTKVKSITAKI